MTDENMDLWDGYDERYNPYYGTCPKHGNWKGSIDECPKCMKTSMEQDMQNIPSSICWTCMFGDEPDTTVRCQYDPKLSTLNQIPRKKHCKHFKEAIEGDYDIEDPRDGAEPFQQYEDDPDE